RLVWQSAFQHGPRAADGGGARTESRGSFAAAVCTADAGIVVENYVMNKLDGKIALVTGASRGVGKGIALGLGEAGATVYITGRTVEEGKAAVALPGTIGQTAREVEALGGNCI